MKSYLLFVALLLSLTVLHAVAQSTNAVPTFTLTPSAPIVMQPAITQSALTIKLVIIDFPHKTMTVDFVGVTKPYTITGAAFTAMVAGFQAQCGTPLLNYIQANPPTQ